MKGISRFTGVPLGMNELLGIKDPHWIAAVASLAAGVGSSIFGAVKAAKQRKKQKQALESKERKEKAWYDKAYNTDYLDTKAGQNLLRRAQEVQDNYIRKADGAAAIGGGTAASSAMAKEAANRTMGNTIANIGAQDTARKQQVEDQHNQNQMNLEDQKANLAHEAAVNTTTAAQNMSNAMFSAAASVEGGGKKSSGANTPSTQNAAQQPVIPTEGQTPVDDSYAKKRLLNMATGVI